MVCPKCMGNMHLKSGDGWVSCDCLKAANSEEVISGIGFPQIKGADNPQLLRTAFDCFSKRKVLALVGGESTQRWACMAAILKKIAYNRRVPIFVFDINSYVDAFFGQQDHEVKAKAKSASLLWVQMDFYRKHAWAQTLITHLLYERTTKATVLTCQQELAEAINFPKVMFDVGGLKWTGK